MALSLESQQQLTNEFSYALKHLYTFGEDLQVVVKQKDLTFFYQFPPEVIRCQIVNNNDLRTKKIQVVSYFYSVQQWAGLLEQWKMQTSDVEEGNYCIVFHRESYVRAQISSKCTNKIIICFLIDLMEYISVTGDKIYYMEHEFGFLPLFLNIYLPDVVDIDPEDKWVTTTRRLLRERINWKSEFTLIPISDEYTNCLRAKVLITTPYSSVPIEQMVSKYLKEYEQLDEQFHKFKINDFIEREPFEGVSYCKFDSIIPIPYVGGDWGLTMEEKCFSFGEGDYFYGRIYCTNQSLNEIIVHPYKYQKIQEKIVEYWEAKGEFKRTSMDCGCLGDGYHFITTLGNDLKGLPYRCQILTRQIKEEPFFLHYDERREVKARLVDTGQILTARVTHLRPVPPNVSKIPMQHITIRWRQPGKKGEILTHEAWDRLRKTIDNHYGGDIIMFKILSPVQIFPEEGTAKVDVSLYHPGTGDDKIDYENMKEITKEYFKSK